MAPINTANIPRPVTLSGELSRLAAAVDSANRLAVRAESISGSLTGHFPVPGGGDEPAQDGYFHTLRELIDLLAANQDRLNFALGRIDESLTDEVPAQSQYASAVGGSPAKYTTEERW